MTRTPTEVAAAAAHRFRALREQATARLTRRGADLEALRTHNAHEARDMMAKAKHRDEPTPAWPAVTAKSLHYAFDPPDDPEPAPPRPTTRPAPPPDPLDDDMSQEETWLR